MLHLAARRAAEEDGRETAEVLRAAGGAEALLPAAAAQVLALEPVRQLVRGAGRGLDHVRSFAEEAADRRLDQAVVRAAQDQRLHALVAQRREILRHGGAQRLVVRVVTAALDQRAPSARSE